MKKCIFIFLMLALFIALTSAAIAASKVECEKWKVELEPASAENTTMTFTTILSVFISSGLGTALIQRKSKAYERSLSRRG